MHPAVRHLARKVLGSRYSRVQLRVNRWRRRGGDPESARLEHEFALSHGLTATGGPFAGLRVPEDVRPEFHMLAAKLLGAYELELHAALEQAIASAPRSVVNIGAGDGYYAVGLAQRLPDATVHAFDIDDRARRVTQAAAQANGVAGRVRVGEAATHAELDRLTGASSLVVCDCESCELELLDPAKAPGLREAALLVELHDWIEPTITSTLRERFSATHEVQLIDTEPRDAALFGVDARLLDEHRPSSQQFLWAAPRSPERP